MMLFDTDVLIWFLRGNARAAQAIDREDSREISQVSYMELLQGARDRAEMRLIKKALSDLTFRTLPLTENIGHRASIYMEEYALSSSMAMSDALIAATAVEHQLVLQTGNRKHFRPIRDLELKIFRP